MQKENNEDQFDPGSPDSAAMGCALFVAALLLAGLYGLWQYYF